MKNKITFKDLSTNDKVITWTVKETEDENIYSAKIIFDYKKEVDMEAIPAIYISADAKKEEKDKKETSKEEKVKMVDARIRGLLSVLQQCIYSCNLFGVKLDGFLQTLSKKEKEHGQKTKAL